MATRSGQPIDAEASSAQAGARPVAVPAADSLARSALTFAVRCHAGQRRDSDGASFIEHPLEVARLLRDAGCSEVVVAAGLLHDVLEDTRVSSGELNARFGPDVTNLVRAVTDHASTQSYRQRKQVLREQVRDAGGDAALLFAADKIAKVRELPTQVQRDRTRFGESPRGSRMRTHLERYHRMRFEHYSESLRMLQRVAPRHPLVKRLAAELESCPIFFGDDAIASSN
jgi:(p)ppGpp synthase/HD superfamily hydrolase